MKLIDANLSPLTWGLLISTPLLISGGQVIFKQLGARLVARGDNGLVSLIYDPYFYLAVTLYGLATFMWIYVLKSVPLSLAYSFNALTFILVPLLAVMFLGEQIGMRYTIGSSLILAGLFVLQG